MSLLQKYSPTKSSEIPQTAVDELKKFLTDKKNKKKAALIYGPTGSCKTSAVYALAKEMKYEVIEVNASDFRNTDQINSVIGNASKQMSLFCSGKIILIDEMDGIAGNEDRGGAIAVVEIINNTTFPVILTANDPWDKKFSSIRTKSKMIEFKELTYLSITNILKNICEKEGIKYEDETVKTLARKAGGDLRAAINDLQCFIDEKEIKKENLEGIGDRNKIESIMNALMKILKGTDINTAVRAFDNTEENIDELFLWLEENISREYKNPDEIARAYDMLSIADVFRGRIRNQQHWRFLVYINNLLSAGVASAKDEKPKGFVQYQPTTRILKIWKSNMSNQKKKNIALKIAQNTHCSRRKTINSSFPYLKIILQKSDYKSRLAKELKLDEEEIEWLKK